MQDSFKRHNPEISHRIKSFPAWTSAFTHLELVPYGAGATELGPDFGVE